MFVTDAQILQDVADALRLTGTGALAAYWTNLVAEFHAQAYNDIIGILAGRKYTLAQILAADNGPAWERSLSRFYIFTQPQTQGGGFSEQAIQSWDIRPMLRNITIVTAGAFVYPLGAAADPVPGEIGVGSWDTSGDLFVANDPDDPRIGLPIEW